MDVVRRWCEDEIAGREDEADGAFRAVWAELAVAEPAPGFADRVLSGVPMATRERSGRRRAPLVAAVAMAFMILGLVGVGAVALMPLMAAGLLDLMSLSARGFVWFVQALDSGLGLWTVLGRAGRAIGTTVAQPSVTAWLIGVELAGVVALYGLHRMLRTERE